MLRLRAFGLWLCISLGVWAQTPEDAALEIGVNYTYTNITTSDTAQSIQTGAAVNAVYLLKSSPPRWGGRSRLGIAAEFAGSGSGSGSLYTYLIGPRWGVEWRHVFFYGGSEIGGARVRVNGVDREGAPAPFVRNTLASSFAVAGVELLFGDRYVVKLLQADDLAFPTPDPAGGKTHWRGAIRASAGIAFRFGKRP